MEGDTRLRMATSPVENKSTAPPALRTVVIVTIVLLATQGQEFNPS
jgi:hypothetical protein